MPYNELSLSPTGYTILLIFLGILLICLIKSKNTITIRYTKNNKLSNTSDLNKPEYSERYGAIMRRQGAYIQAQGRYYN